LELLSQIADTSIFQSVVPIPRNAKLFGNLYYVGFDQVGISDMTKVTKVNEAF